MKGPEAKRIQSLFDSIAKNYDRLNHILSLGVDRIWRKKALKWITDVEEGGRILDIACGTGDFSIETARHSNCSVTVTGLDLSEGMLERMRGKVALAHLQDRVCAEQGNCEQMRFDDCFFDRVTVAFGVRNFENREKALNEILRVLKPGGRFVMLELSVPSNAVLRWFYCIYFTKVLPLVGGLVSGNRTAYNYLPASVLKFPSKEEWMAVMRGCGFRNVIHESFSFGICRMYIGEK